MKTAPLTRSWPLAVAIFVSHAPAIAQVIAAGGAHSMAVCNDGTVMAWGNNGSGELGNGGGSSMTLPVAVDALTGITALAPGKGAHSLARKNDGTLWSWGNNGAGQLGDGTSVPNSNSPVQVTGLSGITTIASGYAFSMAIKEDGTLWSWGYNDNGQLGDGTNLNRNVPGQVNISASNIAVAGGMAHAMALKDDGSVWTWGGNLYGELGNGNNTDSPVPLPVSSLSGVMRIAAGRAHSLAVKDDSTVWAWGANFYGALGDGSTTSRNTPVQVVGLTGVAAVTAGQYFSLALKGDGTVWAWGQNNYGMHGNGGTTDSSTPVQVPSLTGIVALAAGEFHALALKHDGTVWAWGHNGTGVLGNATFTDSFVPVLVQSLCAVPAAVVDVDAEESLSAIPNPSSGAFTILGASVGAQEMELRDAMGRTLNRSRLNGPLRTIDLSGQPCGLYLLNIRTAKGNSVVRLIKQ